MKKQEAIEYMGSKGYPIDEGTRATFKVVDHTGNPLAPENTCYKLYYTCRGNRLRFSIWPNTVGFQGF